MVGGRGLVPGQGLKSSGAGGRCPYPETAVAGQSSEGAIVKVRPLELLRFAPEEELEGKPGAHCKVSARSLISPSTSRRTLSQKCTRRHDPKPDPQPVYDAAEERYYFVTEQRRERDDDEDRDRYQPSGGQVADLLGPGSQVLSCPRSAPVGSPCWSPRSGDGEVGVDLPRRLCHV